MTVTRRLFEIDSDYSCKFEAQQILGVREAQLRKNTALMLELAIPGFDYIPYSDHGYKRESMECLVEFQKLVNEKGRVRAILEIYDHMETYWNERKTSSRRS